MYELISRVYDEFTSDVDRDLMLDFIVSNLRKRTCSNSSVLDLCCGTGELSLTLLRKGFSIIGIDGSTDMLAIASQKLYSNENVLFINQDIRKLYLLDTVGSCICTLDSLNHLNNIEELNIVIKKLSLFIESGGIFIFDLNTLFKHKYVLGNNSFCRENENTFLIWQSEFSENGKVDLYFDLFKKNINNTYNRFSEDFSEIAFNLDDVKKILKENKFSKIKIYGGYDGSKLCSNSERAVFVAKKD